MEVAAELTALGMVVLLKVQGEALMPASSPPWPVLVLDSNGGAHWQAALARSTEGPVTRALHLKLASLSVPSACSVCSCRSSLVFTLFARSSTARLGLGRRLPHGPGSCSPARRPPRCRQSST